MASIRLLEDHIINKIAAGEVVERPLSVVKELVENALDAGATAITIELEEGGRRLISVHDNGFGMSRDDILLAVKRHATSKISSADDLFAVQSMGFRGEALAAIAGVSRFTITSRERGASSGHKVTWEGGELQQELPWNGDEGTTITVAELFFNIPARSKFLKSAASEFASCLELVQSLALSRPQVSITLKHQGKEKMRVTAVPAALRGSGTDMGEAALRHRVGEVWGEDTVGSLIYVKEGNQFGTFEALVSPPGIEKATARNFVCFVNGRWVKDKVLRFGILRGYQSHLLRGRYPQVVGYFVSDPSLVDVNVHPAKTELRFQYGGEVQGILALAVRKALREAGWVQEGGAYRPAPLEGAQQAAPNSSSNSSSEDEEGAFGGGSALPIGKQLRYGASAKDDPATGDESKPPLGGDSSFYEASSGASIVEGRERASKGFAYDQRSHLRPSLDSGDFKSRRQHHEWSGDQRRSVSGAGATSLEPAASSSAASSSAASSSAASSSAASSSAASSSAASSSAANSFATAALASAADAAFPTGSASNAGKAFGLGFALPPLGGGEEVRGDVIPWDELRLIGSFNNCYLFFEAGERLLALDQHAFHERVLFERLQADKSLLKQVQPLVIPEVLKLGAQAAIHLDERQLQLTALGFRFEVLDDEHVEVRAVPSLLAGRDLEALFVELASLRLQGADLEVQGVEAMDEVLATIACHSAVRAGEALGPDEWRQLLGEARQVDFYHNCPHGRRVFKWFSKQQVERWFDR